MRITGPIRLRAMNSKRLRWLLIMLIGVCAALPGASTRSQEKTPDYKNAQLPVERRVADLLGRMTLEEKVAQLTCLWVQRPEAKPQTDFPLRFYRIG